MSIGPKGKVSKSRGRMRRAQSWKITAPNLVKCSKCGELMVAHKVCKACGSYNKQAVLKVD
ncbi:50S ribosomal protein L32 [Anaeropeptidivorans aminofermentans]|jgi:large subunit ribosomal protein L32|uniref:50S ribosomal protein L32 n=1 Tax=Anaeropeptidivorans aminofermentans TaxID=2934315 RepID=UPI002025AE94|nr:50S ribosomal protein L32 [Anaeropeptidivorans aminofermentans]MBE6011236.1 50S ribosomal protein L32 [Lachnospiraceae bacterium]